MPNPSQEMGAYNQQTLPPRMEVALVPPVRESAPERPVQQEVQPAGPLQGPATLPVPAPQQPVTPTPPLVVPVLNPVSALDNNPLTAADDEVIEKEWVDKAKKIVIQTKDDPYQQEKEVSKLQADYLKKRYGKEVKLSSD